MNLKRYIIDIITLVSRKPETPFSLTPTPYPDTQFMHFDEARSMDLYEAVKGRRSIRRLKIPCSLLQGMCSLLRFSLLGPLLGKSF